MEMGDVGTLQQIPIYSHPTYVPFDRNNAGIIELQRVRSGGVGKVSNSAAGLNDGVFQFRVGEKRSKGMDVVRMSTDVEYQKLREHASKAGRRVDMGENNPKRLKGRMR
jgi:hypothetical protein